MVAVLRLSTRWGRLGRGVLGLGLGLWCRLCLWLCAIGLSRRWLVLGPGLCKGGWLVPHTAALWSRGCRCSLCWCSLCSCRGCCGWRWRRCCCWCSWRCVTLWSLFGSGLFGLNIPSWLGSCKESGRICWKDSTFLILSIDSIHRVLLRRLRSALLHACVASPQSSSEQLPSSSSPP